MIAAENQKIHAVDLYRVTNHLPFIVVRVQLSDQHERP